MTLRDLLERVERESLHPTALDLPVTLRRIKRAGSFPAEQHFTIDDVQVDSTNGVVLTLKGYEPWNF